jgi:hypothetical protein
MAAAPWIVSDELWELVEPLDLRLAAQLQAPAHPLRTPRRHAQRIARARLLPRLLSSTRELNLK